MVYIIEDQRDAQPDEIGQTARKQARVALAQADPERQFAQLNAPDGGLHFRQPPVKAEGPMQPAKTRRVLSVKNRIKTLVVILEGPDRLPDILSIGCQHPPFAARGSVPTKEANSSSSNRPSGPVQ